MLRRLLNALIDEDPQLMVGFEACSGDEIVEHCRNFVDVVVLDCEMEPVNNGSIVSTIRRGSKRLPIIILSSSAGHSDEMICRLLRLGASDFSNKPALVGHVDHVLSALRADLGRRMVFWGHLYQRQNRMAGGSPGFMKNSLFHDFQTDAERAAAFLCEDEDTAELRTSTRLSERDVSAIVIGASRQHWDSVLTILESISPGLEIPVLVSAPHHSESVTKQLVNELVQKCDVAVHRADNNSLLSPGIWISLAHDYLFVHREHDGVRIFLEYDVPPEDDGSATNLLFGSASKAYGPNLLGVLLAGSPKNSVIGCEMICKEGGQLIVQDSCFELELKEFLDSDSSQSSSRISWVGLPEIAAKINEIKLCDLSLQLISLDRLPTIK